VKKIAIILTALLTIAACGQLKSTDKIKNNENMGATIFTDNIKEYRYYFEGAGEVAINSVELKEGELTSQYSYTSGNEDRVGTNQLKLQSNGNYSGKWKTTANNGNVYGGNVWLKFNADGTANGKWTWDGMPGDYEIRIDTIKQTKMENRTYFTSFLYFKEGGKEQLKEFQEKAASLFTKYDMRIEYVLMITKKGEIGEAKNLIEQPDHIQVFSLPSIELFQQYATNPEYLELSKIRDDGLRKFNVTIGDLSDIGSLKTNSTTPINERMYALAFINFKENGKEGLMEFNKKGVESGLYEKYGMHLDEVIIPKMSKAIIGELDYETPQMILAFYLDDIKKMPAYLDDPTYKKIAPLRDNGLESYHFFMGKKIE